MVLRPSTFLVLVGAFVAIPQASAQPSQSLLIGPGSSQGARFGESVSLLAGVMVAGAPDDQAGVARVFRRDQQGTWRIEARLVVADGFVGQGFGRAVAMSTDLLFVGAPTDDDLGFHSGSVYVFMRSNGVWQLAAKILAPNGAAEDLFGGALSVQDGTLVVGAPGHSSSGINQSGAVYIYERSSSGVWQFVAQLSHSDQGRADNFGTSVELRGDRLISGATRVRTNNLVRVGAAYVFRRQTSGSWVEEQKLAPSDGMANDRFGTSVSIDGDRVLVCTPAEDHAGTDTGAGYLYKRDSENRWLQDTKLVAHDGGSDERFGSSCQIRGGLAVIGASGARNLSIGGQRAGAVYFFKEGGTGLWTQRDKVLPRSPQAEAAFGHLIAIDGATVMVGAPRDTYIRQRIGTVTVLSISPTYFDSDADGVPDRVDAFPCDPLASAEVFSPAEGAWGMMLFEDFWPLEYDLDFNDTVLAYNYRIHQDSMGRVSRVSLNYEILAMGGRIDAGLGLALPVMTTSNPQVTKLPASAPPASISPQNALLTIVLSNDLRREAFGTSAPLINVVDTQPILQGQSLRATINFLYPASFDTSVAPFDIFTFRVSDPSHEIHGPKYCGTAHLNTALFGTGIDGSSPISGRCFVDKAGLPSALHLPTLAPYPREGESISALYPDVATFAATGGSTHRDFYLRPAAGAGRTPRVGPVAHVPADTMCLTTTP